MSVYLYSLSRITCTESGDPEPNVTWTKNGTYFVNKNTLTINSVTFKDAGHYECTAENRAGKISATIWIDVIGNRKKVKLTRSPYRNSHNLLPQCDSVVPLNFNVFKFKVFA